MLNLESSIMSVRRWVDIFGVSNLVRYAYCDIAWPEGKVWKDSKNTLNPSRQKPEFCGVIFFKNKHISRPDRKSPKV